MAWFAWFALVTQVVTIMVTVPKGGYHTNWWIIGLVYVLGTDTAIIMSTIYELHTIIPPGEAAFTIFAVSGRPSCSTDLSTVQVGASTPV